MKQFQNSRDKEERSCKLLGREVREQFNVNSQESEWHLPSLQCRCAPLYNHQEQTCDQTKLDFWLIATRETTYTVGNCGGNSTFGNLNNFYSKSGRSGTGPNMKLVKKQQLLLVVGKGTGSLVIFCGLDCVPFMLRHDHCRNAGHTDSIFGQHFDLSTWCSF